MIDNKIKCEVFSIKDNKDCCPGAPKIKKGESFIIGHRTPEPKGMCCRAFHAVFPVVFAMRFSDNLGWEKKDGSIEITCPDSFVVYRLTRIKVS